MKTVLLAVTLVALSLGQTWAGNAGEAVEVRIVSDDGHILHTYPVRQKRGIRKVYAEAVKGDHYRIEVKNRLNRRVGLVIAVDGRNIISGDKSWLKNSERMYILEPYESGQFSGWRTGQDRINRFYFTDVPDSYAAAFGDESAMGVIAVAAYPEVRRYEPPVSLSRPTQPYPHALENRDGSGAGVGSGKAERSAPAPAAAAPSIAASKRKSAAKAEQSMDSAGTGYGREEYSPMQIVAFEPESRAVETVYVKYEWRATLCRLGVVTCEQPLRRPPNRLWDNGGFAPPPPGRS